MSESMQDNTPDPIALDIERAKGGDEVAFLRLYDRHSAVVLSVCRSRLTCCTLDEADDACQETFIRAFRKLDQVDGPGVFRSWLYAIARHVCSEHDRSRRRRLHHEGVAMMNHVMEANHVADTDVPVQEAEQAGRLGDAIENLPERERLAIHLYYLDADPIAAAKQALGLSRSGFYKLLDRARRQLAVSLRDPVLE